MRDAKSRHREMLHEGLSRYLDGMTGGSSELVRAQVAASEPGEYETAPLACLAAAEAVGGSAAQALPGAVSLALLAQMGLVFTGLENSGGAASLSTPWGMPRALNAGDAMFALAQESVLSASTGLTAEERLAAVALLDDGGREVVRALHDAGEGDTAVTAAQRALLATALGLGGLMGGGGVPAGERLAQLGREWSDLPEEELTRILANDPRGWMET